MEQKLAAPPVDERMSPQIRRFRTMAPRILSEVLTMPEVQERFQFDPDISLVPYGRQSACYLLNERSEGSLVMKMRQTGGIEEAEALKNWEEAGANVPSVLVAQEFSSKALGGDVAQFTLMKAIVNESGSLAGDCQTFAEGDIATISEVGKHLAAQLALMHKRGTVRPFGPIAQIAQTSHISWNEYLTTNINKYSELLLVSGIAHDMLKKLAKKIDNQNFGEATHFAHTDFFPYNVLLRQKEPIVGVIIDPNPIVTDAYVDLANAVNRWQFRFLVNQKLPSDKNCAETVFDAVFAASLIREYFSITGESLDEDRMLANQIYLGVNRLAADNEFVKAAGEPTPGTRKAVEINVKKGRLFKLIENYIQ